MVDLGFAYWFRWGLFRVCLGLVSDWFLAGLGPTWGWLRVCLGWFVVGLEGQLRFG